MGQGPQRLSRPAGHQMRAQPAHRDTAQATRREELLAHGVLVKQAPSPVAAQGDPFAGRERHWVADVSLERDEPSLAREHVLLLGLHVPEGPEAEGVDAEDAGVADADEYPGGSLGERSDRGASLDVRVLELRAHALHLIDDRWKEELDRLDRGESVTDHERADCRVDVLRVAPVARERKAERTRLLAETADGVDLAVVREDRERLHPREAGQCVRRVAVVTERG